MHITILALGSWGDVLPYAALGHGLKAAGHEVRFITFESFAALVAENGLVFHAIKGDPRSLVANAGANMLALVRSFGSLAEGYARDLSAPYLGETDLILNQLPASLYGYDLAEKYGIPLALAAVIPLARTRAFPLMGFPQLPLPGFNRVTYFLGEQLAWQMFRSVINRWRKRVLSLPPLPISGYFDRLGTADIPILNGFSQHVVQRPADWSEHIHVTGYWFPEDRPWQPPPALQAFLDAGRPPVFIGFGSMPVKAPRKTTEIILDALRKTGQRAILHAGWGGLGQQALPDHVFKIDYAPYSWLFPRLAMAIHHGGSGTTAFGLRAGIPSCVVSFVFDQHFWGRRIAALGAGPRPIRYKRLTTARLQQAIETGAANSQMRQASGHLGQKIRAENGIARAVDVLEGLGEAGRPRA